MSFFTTLYTRLRTRWGTKRLFLSIGGVALLIALISGVLLKSDTPSLPETTKMPEVTVSPLSILTQQEDVITTIGTLEAQKEARLTVETGGRVTSVPVRLGDVVRAGQIIATIENSAERAAVLQAEGVYESALAGASQGDVGSLSAEQAYAEAVTQAENTYRSAFATADGVLRNTVDRVFSISDDSSILGLKIDGRGQTLALNAERKELETFFDTWRTSLLDTTTPAPTSLLSNADAYTTRLAALVTSLTNLLSYDGALADTVERDSLRTAFWAAQGTLAGTLQSLSGARSALILAESQKIQASIGGSTGDISLAQAQIKQALGALQSARARLEKTIIRTPIGGTLDALSLKEGTTAIPGSPAALISSSGALQVVAYVNESDARIITRGAPARIEDTIPGIVTEIGSALDPLTKKVELRIGLTEDANTLTNGQTVRVTLTTPTSATGTTRELRLPIIALKMTPDGPIVFSVNDASILVPHPVTLGAIRGEYVTIVSEIDETLSIVTDARGLKAGAVVTRK